MSLQNQLQMVSTMKLESLLSPKVNITFLHPRLALFLPKFSSLELNLTKKPALNDSWSSNVPLAEFQGMDQLSFVQVGPIVVQAVPPALAVGVRHCGVSVVVVGHEEFVVELAGAVVEQVAGWVLEELVYEVVEQPADEALEELGGVVVGELPDVAAEELGVELVEAPDAKLAAVERPGVSGALHLLHFPGA